MKKISVIIFTLIMLLVFATAAWGISFGARAAGMGGAFTAVADDCSAVYWNPAGITQLKVLTITPGVGLLGNQDQIEAYMEMVVDPNPDAMLDFLNSVGADGLLIGGSAYVGVTTKFIAINAFADMNIMMKQEDVINKSYSELNMYGIGTIAIPIGPIAVGGNIKLVGSSYSQSAFPILNEYNYEYFLANPGLLAPENNYSIEASGEGVAFDVGVLLSLTNRLKIGLTGRNIISSVDWSGTKTTYSFNNDPLNPAFEPDAPQDFSFSKPLPSTWTLGVALRPTSSLLIAADAEMITNPIDPDFNITLYHVGLEQLLLAKTISLRLGAFTTPSEEMGYSCGIGFKLGPVLMDGAYTTLGLTSGFFLTAGFKF